MVGDEVREGEGWDEVEWKSKSVLMSAWSPQGLSTCAPPTSPPPQELLLDIRPHQRDLLGNVPCFLPRSVLGLISAWTEVGGGGGEHDWEGYGVTCSHEW